MGTSLKLKQKRVVLCVDPDPATLRDTQELLRVSGYETQGAVSASTARASIRETKPHLILVDVALPDIDGYEFCGQLQATHENADIPVLLKTPRGSEPARAVAAGAVDVLQKPVTAELLVAKVAEHSQTRSRWKKLRDGSGVWAQSSIRNEFPRFKRYLMRALKLSDADRIKAKDIAHSQLYDPENGLGIEAEAMAQHVASFLRLECLSSVDPSSIRLGVLPSSYARANCVVAVKQGDKMGFALSNPFDWQLVGSLSALISKSSELRLFVTAPSSISRLYSLEESENGEESEDTDAQLMPALLRELRARYTDENASLAGPESGDQSEPLIQLVNQLIEHAYETGASDIHIEPGEDEVVVRYRVDGYLRVVQRLRPQMLIRPLISRLKIMSGLNISEKRLPQDGRIVYKQFSGKDHNFDLRVATAPMNYGEKVVMRIVDKEKSVLPLSSLGFSARHLDVYRSLIRTPYGMVLHVGPTGSGKSMTLYAALNELARPEINIQTAEDPIEYTLPGINQLQVNPSVGLTFSRALRSYLRQDPDIILIGEIRDVETVEIAVEAALTGHLLLSTMHTNDAATTVTRLIQMGVEPFLVSSSVVLVCAQRLLRRFCQTCRTPYEASVEEKALFHLGPDRSLKLWRASGCEECSGVGYRGRTGIHEILVPDDALRLAINQQGVTAESLTRLAVSNCGMTTLYWDAMEKVLNGDTSVEEVYAKVRPDEFDSEPQWIRDKQQSEEPCTSG